MTPKSLRHHVVVVLFLSLEGSRQAEIQKGGGFGEGMSILRARKRSSERMATALMRRTPTIEEQVDGQVSFHIAVGGVWTFTEGRGGVGTNCRESCRRIT